MKILLVEDEEKISKLIKMALENDCHCVDSFSNGEDALKRVAVYDYDLVIMDLMLPGKDGIATSRALRKLKIKWPILILTAIDSLDSKVSGLDCGADDYLTKPFEVKELLARVRALGRREKLVHWPVIVHKELSLDPSICSIKVNDNELKLSPQEYQVVDFLMRHKHQIASKTALGEFLWGFDYAYSNKEAETLNVIISKIRNKICKLNGGENIIMKNSRYGYRLV